MPQHLGRNHAKMYTKYDRILFFKAQKHSHKNKNSGDSVQPFHSKKQGI